MQKIAVTITYSVFSYKSRVDKTMTSITTCTQRPQVTYLDQNQITDQFRANEYLF